MIVAVVPVAAVVVASIGSSLVVGCSFVPLGPFGADSFVGCKYYSYPYYSTALAFDACSVVVVVVPCCSFEMLAFADAKLDPFDATFADAFD